MQADTASLPLSLGSTLPSECLDRIDSTSCSLSTVGSAAELQIDDSTDAELDLPCTEAHDSLQLSAAAISALQQHGAHRFHEDLLRRALNRNNGNEALAVQRLIDTLAWRRERCIDGLLHSPQPFFHSIKAAHRHGVLCRARDGVTPVFVEHVGRFRSAYLSLTKQGIKDQDLLSHLLFVNEHLYQVTDARNLPGGRVIKILDMAGSSWADLKGPSQRLLREFGNLQQQHYQDRLQVAFIVNVPGWWGMAWTVLKNLFEPGVRSRLQLLGSNKAHIFTTLSSVLHEADIPAEYGGPCTRDMYESADELALLQHVDALSERVDSNASRMEGCAKWDSGSEADDEQGMNARHTAERVRRQPSSFQVGEEGWDSQSEADSG